jgi:ketosteroid isomerase-like protein
LFQPGSTKASDRDVAPDHPTRGSAPPDPTSVVREALEALVLGDGSRLDQIFTDDVDFRSPHVAVRSRADLLRTVCSPDPTFGEFELTMSNVVMDHATMAAEWLVEARLVSPVLFGDSILIEPTDRRLQLRGSSFAEFSDERIQRFHCYFDDSEMFDGAPELVHPLRFNARWSAPPSGPGDVR